MISELWKYKFDVSTIAEQLRTDVFHREATFQSPAFGGWSVLSSNGSYKDGWHRGYQIFNANTDEERQNKAAEFAKAGVKKGAEYIVETEICSGEIKKVIDFLRVQNLSPFRARIIQLAALSSSVWHMDSPENKYQVRFHLPIITNPECFFETKTERQHLAADGSGYFLYVNRLHRVVNDGISHRYHLVVDVIDKSGVTDYHSLQYFEQNLKLQIAYQP